MVASTITGASTAFLRAPSMGVEHIVVAVEALSHLYPRGLLIGHRPSQIFHFFEAGQAAVGIYPFDALSFIRNRPGMPVWLFLRPEQGNEMGHYVCAPGQGPTSGYPSSAALAQGEIHAPRMQQSSLAPMEGGMMRARSSDIDPAVLVPSSPEQDSIPNHDVEHIMNTCAVPRHFAVQGFRAYPGDINRAAAHASSLQYSRIQPAQRRRRVQTMITEPSCLLSTHRADTWYTAAPPATPVQQSSDSWFIVTAPACRARA